MTIVRGAVLGACLALPFVLQTGTAGAAQPDGGHYVYAPGTMVVLLPGPGAVTMPNRIEAVPTDFPAARLIAQQDTMMRRMMADMDSMMAMPMPDPQQMIRSVMQGIRQVAPGSGVVITSVSSGNGTCSQTITYGAPGNDGQPVVKVTQAGNACGALAPSGPIGVTQTAPTPQPVVPVPAAPNHDRLWTIGYPLQPIATGTPPRT